MRKSWFLVMICLGVLSLLCRESEAASKASSEKWPSKDLTMVVNFSVGGGLDASARLLAKYWEKELGVKIKVDNRGGASGQIGTSYFLRLPDDGYNILVGAQIFYSSNIVAQNAPYSIDDISLLGFIEMEPASLVVSPSSPYESFEELNAAIKNNPGKLRIGMVSGGATAIMVDYLKKHFGWNIKIVNYDSLAKRMAALLGGHIDFAPVGLMSGIDKERVLLIWADKRSPILPEVPTLQEVLGQKMPYVANARFVAVRSTMKEKHPDRYRILLETLRKTYLNPEYREALKNSGRDRISALLSTEESDRLNREMHETVIRYKGALGGL